MVAYRGYVVVAVMFLLASLLTGESHADLYLDPNSLQTLEERPRRASETLPEADELPVQTDDNLIQGYQYFKRLEDNHNIQKRYFCQKYFIYNPVRGRCIPTLMALKLRHHYKPKRPNPKSFPYPWAYRW